MAGGRRIGFRHPDMHGRDAGFGPEAQQPQQEEGGRVAGMFLRGQHREVRAAAHLPEQGEIGDEQYRPQMRGHQIDPGGVAHLAVTVVKVDEEEGRKGHHFPGDEEEHRIPRGQHHGHARHQQHIEEPVRRQIVFLRPGLAQGKPAGQGTDGPQPEDRQQEQAGERVEPKGELAQRQAPGQAELKDQLPRPAEDAGQTQGAGRHHAARPQHVGQPRHP